MSTGTLWPHFPTGFPTLCSDDMNCTFYKFSNESLRKPVKNSLWKKADPGQVDLPYLSWQTWLIWAAYTR